MGIQDAKQAAVAAPPAGEPNAAVATADAPPVPNMYCLNHPHAARLVTRERFFHFGGEVDANDKLIMVPQGPGQPAVPDMSKAPICPRCSAVSEQLDPLTGLPVKVRVSAIPLEYDEHGAPLIPGAVMSIARRAGEA